MLPKNGAPATAAGAGRRPLVLPLGKRHMLHEIRDSLSHHVRQQQQQQQQGGLSKELSQSTPNLAPKSDPKSNSGQQQQQGKGTSRLCYNQKALAEIREGLKGLEISEPSGGVMNPSSVANGYAFDPHVDVHMVQQLISMGYDEVSVHAGESKLKISLYWRSANTREIKY